MIEALVWLVVGIVVGYVLGRVRPWSRLLVWNWNRTMYRPDTRSADVVLWMILNPLKTLNVKRKTRQERTR